MVSDMRKFFIEYAKCVAILLILAGFFSCNKQSFSDEPEKMEFCSCLNMEEIHKTIPAVNEFLAELPEISVFSTREEMERRFQTLEEWFNSFPCKIDAKILYGYDFYTGRELMRGVAISVKDNEIIRELELDFAMIEHDEHLAINYSQISGYIYYKQDIIHVGTKLTKIDEVFGFINSLDLDVKEIQYGTYISSFPADSTNLKYIRSNLIAKPYTNEVWVTGQLNWYLPGITFFVTLYDMKVKDYQEDWIETMSEYELIKYDFPDYKESVIDGIVYGSGDVIVFLVPEGKGKHWETKFMEYGFVRWTSLSHTRYVVR